MRGNAKMKRLRRGFEHDWNWFNEPLKKLLGGPMSFHTHMRIRWRKRRQREHFDYMERN